MNKTAIKYTSIINKGIKLLPVEDIKELAKYVQFLYVNREGEEFDKLMERTRLSAEKKGYSLKDVNRLIMGVRKRK